MDRSPREEMRAISRRGFIWAGAAVLGGYGFFRLLGTRRQDEGTPWPLRRALEVNEDIWTDAFSDTKLAPTFDPSQRTATRINDIGLVEGFDPAKWTLSLEGADQTAPVTLTMDDIRALPRREMTVQFCCIEGWSMIVTWAGARFRDFMAKYPPLDGAGAAVDLRKIDALPPSVYLETPDGGYYVGMDIRSMLHPQTLLCYEMNGSPLTLDHGAPLRLISPVKYGVKNIKRIGLIRYSWTRAEDYWAQQGYDWYAGL